jgi:hypothetical protein
MGIEGVSGTGRFDRNYSGKPNLGLNFSSRECEHLLFSFRAEGGSGAGADMTATAVAAVFTTDATTMAPVQRNTLTLPAGAMPRRDNQAAEVVVFDEARQDLPKPWVCPDEVADTARQQRAEALERERQSRALASEILRQRQDGQDDEDMTAMLARPQRLVPIAFLSDDALAAALTRQFADSHLIDRMWDNGQLNDWQYAAANKLLGLFNDAGLFSSKVAQIGRNGTGVAEMSDGMAQARHAWNRLMEEIGYPGDELLTGLCLEELTVRGQAARAEALVQALRLLAERWGIDMT